MKQIKNYQPHKGYYFPMFPIILTKDNEIIDGQNRYALCMAMGIEFQVIKLPFTKEQINTKACIDELIKIQKKQDEKLEDIFIKYKIDFKLQLLHCSSQMKIKKFYQFKDLFINDIDFWQELRSAFILSKNTKHYQKEIRELFTSKRKNRNNLMNDDEIEKLKNLPEKITIYRGMTVEEKESEKFGISWSLEKTVAENFALTYAHNYDTVGLDKIVFELEIHKEDIIAYFSDRQEEEILYIHNV